MASRKREFYHQLTASVENLERLIGEPVDEFESSLAESEIRDGFEVTEAASDAVDELQDLRTTLESIRQHHITDHGLAIFAKDLVAGYAPLGVAVSTESSVDFEPFLMASIESIGEKIKEYGSKAWESLKALAKRIKDWVLGLFKKSTDEAADDVKKASEDMKGQHDKYTDWDSVFNETLNEIYKDIDRHNNRYNDPSWSGGDNSDEAKQPKSNDGKHRTTDNQHRQPKKINYRGLYRGFIDEHGKFTMKHLENFLSLAETINKAGIEIVKNDDYTDEAAAKFAETFNAACAGMDFNGVKSYIHHDAGKKSLSHLFALPEPKITQFDEPQRTDLIGASHAILRLKFVLTASPRSSALLDLASDVITSKESKPYLKDYIKIYSDVYKIGKLYILGLHAILRACKHAKE